MQSDSSEGDMADVNFDEPTNSVVKVEKTLWAYLSEQGENRATLP